MLRSQSLSFVAISFRSSIALKFCLNGHKRYFSIKQVMNQRNTALIDLSLTRIQSLLSRLGSPQYRFPIIHVAGTNGKGSTVSYLSSLLQSAIGLKVGTFTSPHLVEERDACQLDGKSIDVEIWQKAKGMVLKIDNDDQEANRCTPFEILTATALTAFSLVERQQKPEILMIEVGMGGALDATNVFNEGQVLASVITSIDLDHQAFLGNTLKEISHQKAGIVKTNGLCIVADQRRRSEEFDDDDDDERDASKILAYQADHHHKEEQEIIETIREVSFERRARLVYAQIPWKRLSQPESDQSETWSTYTIANVRYSPTLYASPKGDFCARTGDHLVPGPCLRLPATRASMLGAFVALQTLWSIARDEIPSGLDMNGSDDNEAVRLRIAFGLRDNAMAKELIANCIASCHLAGRAEWKTLTLCGSSDSMMQEEGQENQNNDILTLVDGAHNPAAAIALRQYVDACIHVHLSSSSYSIAETTITVTWILAFSRGKAIEEMANNLLMEEGVPSKSSILENRMANVSIGECPISSSSKVQVRNRIALVPFSTPVEGMPWVQCVPPEEAVKYFTIRDDVDEALPFPDLTSALRWASQSGRGRVDDETLNMIVIAGSLYLVSDVHRLWQ